MALVGTGLDLRERTEQVGPHVVAVALVVRAGHRATSWLSVRLSFSSPRRILPFTAFAEGWGLYAERLALESGFQRDAFDSLGALQADLFRAVRLVVDTGIHRNRWTRQEAIDYMVRNTGMDSAKVVTEVERYIVSPGQACAYKVGEMKILQLRQKAMDALGPRFDIRKFHDVVLTNGSLPLSLLERVVDDWIAAEKQAETQAGKG